MALVRSNRRPLRVPFAGQITPGILPTFADLENRMNRFVEQAFTDPFGAALPEAIGWTPAMAIVESAKELTVSAELPGIDPKDVAVSVEDGVLTVRGEKKEEREQDDKKEYLYERSYGSFQRSFGLPANIDAGKITAEFDKGVLKVHLPRDGETKPKGRQIEIKTT